MELLEGADLCQVADARGALPRWLVVDYILQALEGLAHAHARGIVHRDLKPSNLFLANRADGTQIIKILDFGISKSTDPVFDSAGETKRAMQLTGGRAVLGSPPYMSPEQVRSPKTVDHRTDIWSLGIVHVRAPHELDAVRRRRDQRDVRADPREGAAADPAARHRRAGRARAHRDEVPREEPRRPLRGRRRARARARRLRLGHVDAVRRSRRRRRSRAALEEASSGPRLKTARVGTARPRARSRRRRVVASTRCSPSSPGPRAPSRGGSPCSARAAGICSRSASSSASPRSCSSRARPSSARARPRLRCGRAPFRVGLGQRRAAAGGNRCPVAGATARDRARAPRRSRERELVGDVQNGVQAPPGTVIGASPSGGSVQRSSARTPPGAAAPRRRRVPLPPAAAAVTKKPTTGDPAQPLPPAETRDRET